MFGDTGFEPREELYYLTTRGAAAACAFWADVSGGYHKDHGIGILGRAACQGAGSYVRGD